MFKKMVLSSGLFQENLNSLESIFTQWENNHGSQRKLSKKENVDEKFSFSILKDREGNYYKIDNDHAVTKAKESYGAQGKYKKLYLLKQVSTSKPQHQIGVKIVTLKEEKNEILASKNTEIFSLFETESSMISTSKNSLTSLNIEEDIFGKKSPIRKPDEIQALKLVGMYIDDFIHKNKHYIIMQHIEGEQLLKFVQVHFANFQLNEQVRAFAKIITSCTEELNFLHQIKISHGDAQLKNFIKRKTDFKCKAIDFGCACINSKLLMENDFGTLALEFVHFDPFFIGTRIESEWITFKKKYSYSNSELNQLLSIINEFEDNAGKKLDKVLKY